MMFDNKTYYRELRQWCKNHHICTRCYKEPAYKNHTMCLVCLGNVREYTAQWAKNKWQDEKYRAKISEQNKIRRESRKAQGLCPVCGRKITDKNYVTCEYCRAKDRRSYFKRARKEGRMTWDERVSGEYCFVCTKPLENPDRTKGAQLCEKCKAKTKIALAKAYEVRKPENNYFRKLNNAWDMERKSKQKVKKGD